MARHPSSSCPDTAAPLRAVPVAGKPGWAVGHQTGWPQPGWHCGDTEGEAKLVLWRQKWSCGLTCACLCCCESCFPFVLVLRGDKLLWWCRTGRVIHLSVGWGRYRRAGSSLWHLQCKTGDTSWLQTLCPSQTKLGKRHSPLKREVAEN